MLRAKLAEEGRLTVPRRAGSALVALLLAFGLGCGPGPASRVALGGASQLEPRAPRKPALPSEPAVTLSADEAAAADQAPVVEVSAQGSVDVTAPAAAAGPFIQRAPAVGDVWVRLTDSDFSVAAVSLVGGGSTTIDVRVVSHQELRFEVLAVAEGSVSKLALHYVDARSTTQMLGEELPETDAVSGKRYLVTFSAGKPSVTTQRGQKPPSVELDTVQDDADEPSQNQLALKELAGLLVLGKGELSSAAAAALAGGDQKDVKLTSAKASLRTLSQSPPGAGNAVLDVSYVLSGTTKADGLKMHAVLGGSVVVGPSPLRIQAFSVSGPISIGVADPNGGRMDGTGRMKMDVSYRY